MSTKANPTLAVVIPTYNRPEYLTNALHSLVKQSYSNWAATVVDDASDVSYEAVKEYFKSDRRIHFIHKKTNEGINASRNVGLTYALSTEFDFIIFLDDDDTFASDYFAEAIQVVNNHPEYGWFMSNNYGEKKKSTRDIVSAGEMDFIDDYIYRKFRGDKAHLFSREVIENIRLDDRFRSSHRWRFYIQIAAQTKIWAFPHQSVFKQYLDGGITQKSAKKHPKNCQEIIYRFARHWYVIRLRPLKIVAYKYFLMELVKSIRYFAMITWRR